MSFNKERDKEEVNFFGVMGSITLGNGKKVKKMEAVIEDLKKDKLILANGLMVK